jgi:Zn-dependent M28 family amino/carboxypeptidase
VPYSVGSGSLGWPYRICDAGFALIMTLHADLTPFSPGANDDASGIGVTLAVVEQLRSQPLLYAQVCLVLTGCEETASYGILDFIHRHKDDLGKDAMYIINDQVAAGRLSYLLTDGLIKKHKTHPAALEIAHQAKLALPHLQIIEDTGTANTDATPATKLGCKAITVVANPPPGSGESAHWHQMSDTIENVDSRTLEDALTFTIQLLQIIDSNGIELNGEYHLEETIGS